MNIAHSETTPWGPVRTLRGGKLTLKELLDGDDSSRTNFSLVLADTDVSFKSPRHRHNFDQIRITLEGSTNYGPKQNIEVGDIAYFPEGTHYGPQDQELVGQSSMAMVIQFGGAAGNGYMSQRQARAAQQALEAFGRFEGGIYKRERGAEGGRVNQDAYEAIWEHHNGRPIDYPRPRLTEPVHFRAANIPWQPVDGQPGAFVKELGTFSERGIRLACLKIEAGASYALPALQQEHVLFFNQGRGDFAAGEHWAPYDAAHLAAGEAATLRASETTEALVLALPHF
ncbi:MAG TPA: hypothetical protein VLK85_17895 [Ramlibacter sp.]|nr:hypothetical protein [Ramlibacter sp.]